MAIKVLPPEFAGDSERLARFAQEARAAAALNHPHIAAVYDVGHEDGIHFMVQEHLEGRTLRAAIAEGRLPLKKGLKLALEIVEGLGAAHAEGIVHRDLKPENIFVSPDGHAKILDFGLAKLTELAAPSGDASASMSPTVLGTVAGQMMGTAGYMAPEQVEGIDVDHRADIFAFGCVLYELGAGQQAFRGKNLVDTLHRVSNVDPDGLITIDGSLPEQLQRILDKSLAKDPAARYQTSGDLAVDLRALIASVDAGDATPVALAGARLGGRGLSPAVTAGVGLLGIMIGAFVVAMWPAVETTPAAPTHFEVDLADGDTFSGANRRTVALAPDGRKLAFTDEGRMFLRYFSDPELVAVRGTEGARTPIFSPDSEWIAFCSNNQLLKVPLSGGAPLQLATLRECYLGGSWSHGAILLGMDGGGILRVPEEGGDAEVLFEVEDGVQIQGPFLLPGGEWVVYSAAQNVPWSDAQILARSLTSGEERLLVSGGVEPRFVRSGHLTYARDGVLLAVPFDPVRVETTGGAVTLLDGLAMPSNGGAYSDTTVDGDLLYFQGGSGGGNNLRPAWYGLDGDLEVLPFEPTDMVHQAISPDGLRLAVIQVGSGGEGELWVYELERGARQRLTAAGVRARDPVWSPDGAWVYFHSQEGSRGGVSRIRSDFTGTAEVITEDTQTLYPNSISPDGSTLAVATPDGGWDIRLIDIESGEVEDLVASPALKASPAFSPDGRLVAYISNESGNFQVYVRDLEAGRRYIASPGDGAYPGWSPDGSTLYYISGSTYTAVEVTVGDGVQFGPERALFPATARAGFPRAAIKPSPVGDRFLIMTPADSAGSADEGAFTRRMQVVLGWGQVLRERVTSR